MTNERSITEPYDPDAAMPFPRSRPTGRVRYDWNQVAEELRAHPGQWRLLEKGAPRSQAAALHRRSIRALHDTFGWTYRVMTENNNTETETCDIYLQAVPTKGA